MASSMELGGNGPFAVLSDADVEAAAEGAVIAKFRNAGQACVTANRIIVHKDVLPAFRESFLKRVAELRVGAGTAAGTTVGPLIDAKQRGVLKLLEAAKVEGANVLAGGHALDGEGFFIEPTVIDGVAPGSAIACAEIFGPVAVLYAADSDDAATDRFGSVDILVLSGPGPEPGTAGGLSSVELASAFDLLVRPQHALVSSFLPGMQEQKWGRILAIGSSGVVAPLPNLALSNTGRTALAGYLKTLAAEVAVDAVRHRDGAPVRRRSGPQPVAPQQRKRTTAGEFPAVVLFSSARLNRSSYRYRASKRHQRVSWDPELPAGMRPASAPAGPAFRWRFPCCPLRASTGTCRRARRPSAFRC
ncbi:uncharacterized protein YraI [Arthrobacter sp. UYCu723]